MKIATLKKKRISKSPKKLFCFSTVNDGNLYTVEQVVKGSRFSA
jgi:hypothetical protein